MITYTRLTRHPEAARSLIGFAAPEAIGMSLPAFDALYAEFEVAHEERLATATHTRRTRQPRQRAVGAGRRYTYSLRDRLLMTLFWLRVYTTYAVMGFLFELDRTVIVLTHALRDRRQRQGCAGDIGQHDQLHL